MPPWLPVDGQLPIAPVGETRIGPTSSASLASRRNNRTGSPPSSPSRRDSSRRSATTSSGSRGPTEPPPRTTAAARDSSLIPAKNLEIIIGIPPYIAHNNPRQKDGWGDESFLVKYRLLSKNEENGNYIVTAFLGATVPTGSYKNGAAHAVITPTLALGKGWGNFDVVTTAGIQLPVADSSKLGQPIVWNVTGQYRVLRKIWPEVEMNSTFFHNGPNRGKQQVFVTPGLVLGKFPIWRRLGATVGAGVQVAATHFHTYNHATILTMRLPF